MTLRFSSETVTARIRLADGSPLNRTIEIRTSPITGRTARITYSRSEEREPGTESLPPPPPFAEETENCPFCSHNLETATPRMEPDLFEPGRMIRGSSVLFPNLFPYGQFSAVSLLGEDHFVEIGTASPESYRDSLLNCRDYLLKVLAHDRAAVYQAITQNHLPSAGGSLLHPHLQVQADRVPANHQRFLRQRATDYHEATGRLLLGDYLEHELDDTRRLLGRTGDWHWLTSFAPEGFYEIYGILPTVTNLARISDAQWASLGLGITRCQKFYRSLGRNGYNLGILFDHGCQWLEVRATLTVRSNYAPWVRADFTGFELGPGDMATFDSPEAVAQAGRRFWQS